MDVLKTQSEAPPGSVVIDQALWMAPWGPLQINLTCQSPHCVYMVEVESKRGRVNRWCRFFSIPKALTVKLQIIRAAE